MRGSIFPDGVTVDHTALRRTETSKAQAILRNRLSWTSRGVLSGGVVSVNAVAPNTHIDVTQLTGFAPDGEYIETDSAYFDIALASEVLGVVNYVCAVYTETNTHEQPHESDGETYPIFSEMAWRIRVYTEADFNALPTTDDNLANDSQDRSLLLALVTANGPGVALTVSSIQSPMDFNNILYSTPRSLASITGVDVLSISPDTPVGDGTLSYTYAAPNTYTFTWTTSNGVGAAVPITADSTFDLLDGAGEHIRIFVAVSLLPTVGPFPMTETITITNLYYQQLPRLTAEDDLHRNYIGTGTVTPQNPHGSSMDDITGESFSLLDEHQDVMHCNGIWRGSASSCLSVSINEATSPDQFDVTAPVGADLYYVNGKKLNSIIDGAAVAIPPPANQTAYLYEIYVNDETVVTYTQKAAYPVGRTVTGTWIVGMSPNYPAGTGVLEVAAAGPGPWTFTWDGGKFYILPAGAPSQAIRLYAEDGVHWIDLWVHTGGGTPDTILPVANVNDTISIAASATDGTNEFMRIASVVYWYEAVAFSWRLGYPPTAASRFVVDNRHWGNLCTRNMADDALQDLVYSPNNELGRSGVLLRRNGVYNEFQYTLTGGLGIDINGGSYYCRGQRLTADTVQSLAVAPGNLDQLIWADMEGVYHVLDVTGTFGGDRQAAMRYVLGFAQDVPAVSDTYHFMDNFDAPERGVLLYWVSTVGAAITEIVDFMQNVNQVLDPWSVGSRISFLADTHAQAAYDNLFTAFEYARFSMYSDATFKEDRGAVTITVIGTAEINFMIDQPEYVNVRGTQGINTPAQSLVRSNVSTEPAWKLGRGCKVSEIGIFNADSTWPVFAPRDYSTIENCYCSSAGGAFMTWMTAGATRVDGVVVQNNVTTGCAFITGLVAATNGLRGWVIQGNKIYNVPAQTLTTLPIAVLLYNTEKLVFADNLIEIPDTGPLGTEAGIGVSITTAPGAAVQGRDVVIRHNNIRIGSSAAHGALVGPLGMYLNDIWFATITGNIIEAYTGAVSECSTGIYAESLINSSLTENKFNALGGGIALTGSCYDVDISRNKFLAIAHNGIWVKITDFPVLSSAYGLKIENNDLYAFAKGNQGGLYLTNELAGIVVESNLDAGPYQLANVSISNNIIAALVSPTGFVRGIRLEVDAALALSVASEFKINGNLIYALLSGTSSTRGIYILGATGIGPYGMKVVSVNDNHIFFTANTITQRVAGIDIETTTIDTTVNNNVVLLASSNDASNGFALYMGDTGTVQAPHDYVVSGNILYGLRGAFFAKCVSRSVISGNTMYSKGTGVYLVYPKRDLAVLEGNSIYVEAINGNPWSGTLGGDVGSHCITCADAVAEDGVLLLNNNLYLLGYTVGPAVDDVPAGSACVSLRDMTSVQIDGGRMASNAKTVNTTNGSALPDFGYLCYLRAPASHLPSHYSVKNVTFDDRQEDIGTTVTPLSALFIEPNMVAVPAWDHANGESLHAHIGNNTFITSKYDTIAPAFNDEANTQNPAALFPYVIYVSIGFGVTFVDVESELYFIGNGLFVPAGYVGIPHVYIPLPSGGWAGGNVGWCFYDVNTLQNHCTFNGVGGPGTVAGKWWV